MKKQLDEINILRPITILLLVIMHSFTMYSGGWSLPEGITNDIRAYFWIAKTTYSSMLEMFVFISGYIFAYQIYELQRKYTFKTIINKKFKRLIIPSIVFSLLYALFFYNKEFNIITFSYDILSGLGHLWFLPMLFWCFIFTYLILKINIKEEIKLLFLFCCSIISFVPLPFRLSRAMYYLFFFYLAFYILKNKDFIVKKFVNVKTIFFVLLLFLLLFVPLTLYREQLNIRISTEEKIIYKAILFCVYNFSRIIYAIIGLLLNYITILYFVRFIEKVPKWVVKINGLCMGVYIFHQFILQGLYYNTNLPSLLGSYWLPWVGFLITIFFSFLLTLLLKATKVGRKLL